MSRFDDCLKEVLRHEGGFVNHPRDPGGATNKGITLGTYRATLAPNASVTDLRNIPSAHVKKIYRDHYWTPIDGDGLGPGVDLCVFDLAVNSGVSRAKRMFRDVMVLHGVNDAELINTLCDNRMRFLRGLKHWPTFGKGWTRRVEDVRKKSLEALSVAVDVEPEPELPQEVKDGWLLTLIKWIFGK